MYLLYVDESDTTTDPLARDALRVCCLCGVRVVDSSYGATTAALQKFLSGWPQTTAPAFEVKGRHLFQGEGVWKGVDPGERARFSTEFSVLIAKLNVKLFSALKASHNFTADYGVLLDLLVARAARETAKSGSKTGRQLLVVFDRRPDLNVSHSAAMRGIRAGIVAKHKSACHFIDHGYEADSVHAPLIQVADFAAYFIRKRRTLIRQDTEAAKAHDPRVIAAVDAIVSTLAPKVIEALPPKSPT